MSWCPKGLRQLQMAMHPAPQRYLLHYPLRGGRIMNLIGCGQAAGWEEEGLVDPRHQRGVCKRLFRLLSGHHWP